MGPSRMYRSAPAKLCESEALGAERARSPAAGGRASARAHASFLRVQEPCNVCSGSPSAVSLKSRRDSSFQSKSVASPSIYFSTMPAARASTFGGMRRSSCVSCHSRLSPVCSPAPMAGRDALRPWAPVPRAPRRTSRACTRRAPKPRAPPMAWRPACGAASAQTDDRPPAPRCRAGARGRRPRDSSHL